MSVLNNLYKSGGYGVVFAQVLCAVGFVSLTSSCSKPSATKTDTDEQRTITHVHRTEPTTDHAQVKRPRRIILMIGDGMGVPAISAAAYAKGTPLSMLDMPTVSFMRTHEHEFVTTDSAASATAFATGHKTHFEGVSVKPGTTHETEGEPSNHLETVVKVAQQSGLRTGLVATSRIVHATPAAFASHRAHRSSYEEIALDMSGANVDVLMGAGSKYFNARKDERDLLGEMQKNGNYRVTQSPEELAKWSSQGEFQRTVALFHEKDMPPVSSGERAVSLAKMTEDAIALLDKDNPDGFFLMVEGSQIDWEEHAMNGPGTVAETLDFDQAIDVARAYAGQRDDTLVIVTADHETGGLALMDPYTLEGPMKKLGGESGIKALTAGSDVEFPDPISFLPLGQPDASTPSRSLVPPMLEDKRLATAFGFLSIASRKGWTREQSTFIATHTATMVPIFADGAFHQLLSSVHDNADLGELLKQLFRAQDTDPLAKGIKAREEDLSGTPKNVVLIIGDGMGLSSLTATEYVHGLNTLELPVQGLVATHGADRLVNDSAATATALATGQRTMYRSVGMQPDPQNVDKMLSAVTVLEEAEKKGLRTGLVTTTRLTHATPAAFYAHNADRNQELEIAGDFVSLADRIENSDGVDVVFAGGSKYLDYKQQKALRERGVDVQIPCKKDYVSTSDQFLCLYDEGVLDEAPKRLSGESTAPGLAKMTEDALRMLDASDKEDKGFFLMVEGGQIDWALHALETDARVLDEVHDLDNAVQVAMRYAETHKDTLVIVTADHDHTLSVLDNHYGFVRKQCGIAKRCGGSVKLEEIPIRDAASIHRGEGFADKTLQGADFDKPGVILQYAWPVQAAAMVKHSPGPHSANFVPLFAFGPGADQLAGFHQQPEIGEILLKWARK